MPVDDDLPRDSDRRPRPTSAPDASQPGVPVRAVIPTLLDDVVRGALDPAYADAAARRRDRAAAAAAAAAAGAADSDSGTGTGSSGSGSPPRHRRGRPVSLLVLLVAGVLVAAAVHRQSVAAPEQSRTRAALVADVAAQTSANALLARQIQALNQANADLRAQELSSSTEGADLTGQIDSLEPVVGQQAVVGPGVRVTLADPPASRGLDGTAGDTEDTDGAEGAGRYPGQLPPAARLLDSDVAEVVNLLWAAGAEAMAVSGIRLTATTAIRSAGEAVLVGFRPVVSPYLIEVVGDPAVLENALANAAVSARLRALAAEYGGEFSVSSAGEITVPAAPVTTPRRAGGLVSVVPS